MNALTKHSLRCLIYVSTLNMLACGPAQDSAEEQATTEVRPRPPRGVTPIYLIQSYHLDPIGSNETGGKRTYETHRDSIQWLLAQSEITGQKINAFATGPTAEAIVNSGHESEYADFMPGQKHALGVHLHSHRKPISSGNTDWIWNSVSSSSTDEEEVRAVFEDQIAFVNQIYAANGVDPRENTIFHGTHNRVDALMSDLLGISEERSVAYPNTFSTLEGPRGYYHPYRGPDVSVDGSIPVDELENFDSPFVHVSISSGIIGFDQEHGPEGLVLGTTPYLKRDFILQLLEWREVERGATREVPRVWMYGWGSHPYQTTQNYTGTDGRLVRESWEEMTTWLNEHFVDQSTSRGNVVAEWANFREVTDAFETWESKNPGISSANLDELGETSLALKPIHEALEAARYIDAVADLPDKVQGHEFQLSSGQSAYLFWSDAGGIEISTTGLPRERSLLFGNGKQRNHRGPTLRITDRPVLIF